MKNKTIMLICNAGMSTSFLVNKMLSYAEEKNYDVEIFAISTLEIDEQIQNKKIDVVLLGPQIQYMLNTISEQIADLNIPIAVINTVDYGMMKGDKVLESALKLLEKENG